MSSIWRSEQWTSVWRTSDGFRPLAASASASDSRTPSIHSIVSTERVESSGRIAGDVTLGSEP